MKTLRVIFYAAMACSIALTVRLNAAEATPAPPPVTTTNTGVPEVIFDKEVLELFSTLPVLDQGRIKPLDTVARFRLLAYHGKQSIKVDGRPEFGEHKKLTALQWLLLSWYRPEVAKDLPLFVVDNSEAVVEIGMEAKGLRDRYSYNEVESAVSALMAKLPEIGQIDAKKRTPSQRYLAKLGTDFFDYTFVVKHFSFLREPFGDAANTLPKELLADASKAPEMLEFVPKLKDFLSKNQEMLMPAGAPQPWLEQFSRTLMMAEMSRNPEQKLRIFPPSDKENEEWQSPGSVLQNLDKIGPAQVAEFKLWEDMYRSMNDPAAFKAKLKELHDSVTQAAEARGEGTRVNMEVSYHKRDYMFKSLYIFFFGMLMMGLSWVSPHGWLGRWGVRLSFISMLVGSVVLAVGIIIRCVIMQRPPITTLYETILFITWAGVVFGLIAEMLTKKAVGLLVSTVCGVCGMFLSIRYMNMEATDTLQQLQAVLLTNFWLATHVPIINLGYAAGMVSAIIAMIYFAGRLFGVVRHADEVAKAITRMSYGFVMTGLFLSLVGTILGGIWANYSWGRFWGWDPKENGALLIVLMNLIILHARLGGYIREIGFHACNIILGMIVVFSWFGVNQLSVGLHNYGFTDGASFWLSVFWGSQLLFLMYAAVLKLIERGKKKKEPEARGRVSGKKARA